MAKVFTEQSVLAGFLNDTSAVHMNEEWGKVVWWLFGDKGAFNNFNNPNNDQKKAASFFCGQLLSKGKASKQTMHFTFAGRILKVLHKEDKLIYKDDEIPRQRASAVAAWINAKMDLQITSALGACTQTKLPDYYRNLVCTGFHFFAQLVLGMYDEQGTLQNNVSIVGSEKQVVLNGKDTLLDINLDMICCLAVALGAYNIRMGKEKNEAFSMLKKITSYYHVDELKFDPAWIEEVEVGSQFSENVDKYIDDIISKMSLFKSATKVSQKKKTGGLNV